MQGVLIKGLSSSIWILKELIDDRTISLHCPTQHMKADILTKPLGGHHFKGQCTTLLTSETQEGVSRSSLQLNETLSYNSLN